MSYSRVLPAFFSRALKNGLSLDAAHFDPSRFLKKNWCLTQEKTVFASPLAWTVVVTKANIQENIAFERKRGSNVRLLMLLMTIVRGLV